VGDAVPVCVQAAADAATATTTVSALREDENGAR
jgi:hypothetical protein